MFDLFFEFFFDYINFYYYNSFHKIHAFEKDIVRYIIIFNRFSGAFKLGNRRGCLLRE